MSDVTIYTKTGCPYCAAAMKHYTEQGVPFTEVNVTEQPDKQNTVLDLTNGQRAVPVIVEGGSVTVGFGGS